MEDSNSFIRPRYSEDNITSHIGFLDAERKKLTKLWIKKGFLSKFIQLYMTVLILNYFIDRALGLESNATFHLLVTVAATFYYCPVKNWYKKATRSEAELYLRVLLCAPQVPGASKEKLKKIETYCSEINPYSD